jgi:hypothetical protein
VQAAGLLVGVEAWRDTAAGEVLGGLALPRLGLPGSRPDWWMEENCAKLQGLSASAEFYTGFRTLGVVDLIESQWTA